MFYAINEDTRTEMFEVFMDMSEDLNANDEFSLEIQDVALRIYHGQFKRFASDLQLAIFEHDEKASRKDIYDSVYYWIKERLATNSIAPRPSIH